MKMRVLLVLFFFLLSQEGIVFAEEEKQAPEAFPIAPPAGMIFKTIQDGAGNAVKIAVWGERCKSFWYFEPETENIGKFYLYPGDITATQEGKLFQEIKFLTKEGKEYYGPIKEPLTFQFTACDWDQSGMSCIDYTQPFEVYLPPNISLNIQKGTAIKVNSVEVEVK